MRPQSFVGARKPAADGTSPCGVVHRCHCPFSASWSPSSSLGVVVRAQGPQGANVARCFASGRGSKDSMPHLLYSSVMIVASVVLEIAGLARGVSPGVSLKLVCCSAFAGAVDPTKEEPLAGRFTTRDTAQRLCLNAVR